MPSPLTRRRFLHLLGQGAVAAAVPVPLLAEASGTVTISLLHTTDLHGHILPTTDYHARPNLGGLARCASQIRAWRAANPNSLLLDVGDVYQGTAVSLASRGQLMIRCFTALGYDAWVVGNHEFDWGADAFAAAVAASPMPLLSGNARLAGHALDRIRPWMMKEIAGIRLAVIGLTTPALTTWLPPEYLRDYEALDPVESLRRILGEAAAQKPDAIVLAGHMGLKHRDDFANCVGALTRDFPQLAVCLGGHTHEDWPGEYIHGVLYTQADHYGIHAGKVDLIFDRATHRLIDRQATTVLMDGSVPFDPQIMALAQTDLAAAERELARPIGALTEPFRASSVFGRPGEQERLIASGMIEALQKRGAHADVVVHGLFDEKRVLEPGPKTVGDMWRLLPYENEIVSFDARPRAGDRRRARPAPDHGPAGRGRGHREGMARDRSAPAQWRAVIAAKEVPYRRQLARFAIGRRTAAGPGADGRRSKRAARAAPGRDARCRDRFLHRAGQNWRGRFAGGRLGREFARRAVRIARPFRPGPRRLKRSSDQPERERVTVQVALRRADRADDRADGRE